MKRDSLRKRASTLIDRLATGARDERARGRLVTAIAQLQAKEIPAYGRLVDARHRLHPGELVALPTDVFRFARIAMHEAADDVRVFYTSGTTHGERGMHAFRDLGLYDRAAQHEARRMLFPDRDRMQLLILAPHARQAMDSSLSYMLARFCDWFGTTSTYGFEDGTLDVEVTKGALLAACAAREPIALLGTSFAFVHLEDALGDARFALPAGSRIMQTGGFKGRSRSVEPEEMRRLLSLRYGVPETHIVAEYGMTELSSQMYETTLRDALRKRPTAPRRYEPPGWVRVVPVHPDTLEPVPVGEVGLLRIEDAANVDSCAVLQTADLAREVHGGFELLGRAPAAVPRGCSLALDEALGGRR